MSGSAARREVHNQIKSSPMPIFHSSSPNGMFRERWCARHDLHGPALANTVRQCDGLVNMMSFWTFSDVFEESGPIAKPFIGMFGLRAKGGINKPSYYAFELLHQLGSERLTNSSQDLIATENAGGEVEVAAWNLVDPANWDRTEQLNFDSSMFPLTRA